MPRLCVFLLLDELQQFMEEVKSLGYQDKPPYERLRSILQDGLKSIKSKDDGRLDFSAASGPSSSRVQVGSLTDSEPGSPVPESYSLVSGPLSVNIGTWSLNSSPWSRVNQSVFKMGLS